MLIKKVQMIHPGIDAKYHHLRTGYQSYPPPSGLEIIADYAKQFSPETKFEIFDGNVTPCNEIVEQLDADVVGISDWFTNHSSAIQLARSAKLKSPDTKVVIGGPNASNLGERILYNHPEVDFVAYGDGEKTVAQLLQGVPTERVENLWYRGSDGKIHFSSGHGVRLNDLGLFDFDHLFETDLVKYDSTKESYIESIDMTPVPISSIRGCIKAVKSGLCSYCSIPMSNCVRVMNPEKVWKQITYLNSKYGIRIFFETGDNFIVGDYPEKLLQSKPNHLNVSFRIYANPDTINSINVQILKMIGVDEVFVGIESVDLGILCKANKCFDPSNIERTVQLLKKNGIRVFLPFLFGLPGETSNSVCENYRFAKYLISKYDNIQRILLSLAVPLVGTPWFNSLLADSEIVTAYDDNGMRSLSTDDDIQYDRLFLLSLHKHSDVSFSDIYTLLSKPLPNRLEGRIGGFGCLEESVLELERNVLV